MAEQIEIVWTRADFEGIVNRPLTDKEWEVLASEVHGDLEEVYIPECISSKFEILDHLVLQDSKYEKENN
jgi:hypothetical protein